MMLPENASGWMLSRAVHQAIDFVAPPPQSRVRHIVACAKSGFANLGLDDKQRLQNVAAVLGRIEEREVAQRSRRSSSVYERGIER